MSNIAAVRIQYFTRINLSLFTRSKSDEDLQDFLDIVKNVIDIMGVTLSQSADLATYQLQDT